VATLQQQFGNLVKRRRQAAGLSQEALAGQAGLHRTYIGLLELGMRMPSIEVLQKVTKGLKTTMTDLVSELEGSENGEGEVSQNQREPEGPGPTRRTKK